MASEFIFKIWFKDEGKIVGDNDCTDLAGVDSFKLQESITVGFAGKLYGGSIIALDISTSSANWLGFVDFNRFLTSNNCKARATLFNTSESKLGDVLDFGKVLVVGNSNLEFSLEGVWGNKKFRASVPDIVEYSFGFKGRWDVWIVDGYVFIRDEYICDVVACKKKKYW